MYILKCWNDEEEFYKIGRTYSTVNKRFKYKSLLPYDYQIITQVVSEDVKHLCELEWTLKNCNKNHKYLPKLEFGGRYECFRELNMSCFEDYNLNINN